MEKKQNLTMRFLLHILIMTDYGALLFLLLQAARERWDLARDLWLCGAMLTAFVLAMLAAILRTKKHINILWPWLSAAGSLAAAVTAYILRLNW